ncbi:MAG: hypothetical protein ACRDWE_12320, partial [Acidimicrobiales bacterium]
GEALKLDRSDIDWHEGVLLIRDSKFGKTRQIPLLASTISALMNLPPPTGHFLGQNGGSARRELST